MPICTTCTYKISYLYTVYESANNLRLEQCPKCLNFADPYVEHDSLTLLLDLILLKRDVFRHLLFNRGYEPRRATSNSSSNSSQKDSEKASSEKGKEKNEDEDMNRMRKVESRREKDRWKLIFQLGFVLIFMDAFIRWSHLSTSNEPGDIVSSLWTKERIEPLLRIFAGCIIETIAFHTGIALTSAFVLKVVSLWRRRKGERVDKSGKSDSEQQERGGSSVREQLRPSHVPLTLLYSSLTKLFLLLLLVLWKPSTAPSSSSARFSLRPNRTSETQAQTSGSLNPFLNLVPGLGNLSTTTNEVVQRALEMLDDDKLDREWVVRNVLGGLAAGFGLRVVLDVQPVLTTLIILTGWAAKTFVANLVSTWVNKGDATGDVFLAYSIP